MKTGMSARRVATFLLLPLLLCLSQVLHAASGVDWLLSSSRADGAMVGAAERVDPFTATAEALVTLQSQGAAAEPPLQTARDYLANAERGNLAHLAASIRAGAAFGRLDPAEVIRLITAQGRDFGFGEEEGFDSVLVDSAWALEALAVTGESRGQVAWDTLGYLLDRQRADGAWGEDTDDSVVAVTAAVLLALSSYRDWSDFSAQTNAAQQFLLSRRDADALWGDTARSARALIALLASGTPAETLADGLAALRARQGSDGAWHGEVLATALALRALAASGSPADPTGVGGSGLGSIAGQVVDGRSGLPIPGVNVALTGPTPKNGIYTNADGRFLISDLVSGDYTLSLTAAGYAVLGGGARIAPGQRADLGELRLLQEGNTTTSTVRGEIALAAGGQPISGVSVTLYDSTGTIERHSTVTNADGVYQLSGLTPGAVLLQATLAGHSTATGEFTLTAGGTYLFSAVLTPVEAPRTSIEGQVTDIATGLPLEDAAISVTGVNDLLIRVAADGRYRVDDLTPGEMTLQVTADGFNGVVATITLHDDEVINFSPRLYPRSDQAPSNNQAQVAGLVVDLVTGLPLAGILVEGRFGSDNRSLVTGEDGRFVFGEIGELNGNLRISGDAYETAEFGITLTPYLTTNLGEVALLPSSVLALFPDLRVVAVDTTEAVVDGDTLVLNGRIGVELANAGTAEAAAGVMVTLFHDADRDGKRDINEPLLGHGFTSAPMDAGGQTRLDIAVGGALPFLDAPISAWVDSTEQVVESIEQNNVADSGANCRTTDGVPLPDVTLSLPRVVEQRDGRFHLSARIGNSGDLGVPAGGWVSFFEGDPDSGGTLAGTAELPALMPNAYFDALLADVSLSGTHSIVAVVDFEDSIAECREDNNRFAARAPDLKPDLVVRDIDYSGVITRLDDLSVGGELLVTVANDGNFAAEGSVEYRAFIDGDHDGVFGVADTLLGAAREELDLGVGEQTGIALAVNGSLDFRDAPISVELDSAGELAEKNEVNNRLSTDSLFCGAASGGRTYTLNSDFDHGTTINLSTAVPDQLSLDDATRAFPFIWVPASGRGTIIKMDTRTGEILGEYLSSPNGRSRNPSRTTVDKNGNVWAGNRNESLGSRGSVVQIGLAENGQCEDRNGNGVIDTSTGLGDVRIWNGYWGEDYGGGVSTARDECIIKYIRVDGEHVRHVSVDENNNVWTAGALGRDNSFNLIDGESGEILGGFDYGCGGYGGLVDDNGVLWSVSARPSDLLLRYDTKGTIDFSDDTYECNYVRSSYGLGSDSDGNIWNTLFYLGKVSKFDSSGALIGTYGSGGQWPRGVVQTPDGNIWIANSGSNTVSRLTSSGELLATIQVGEHPTGVSVDAAGKVWVANLNWHSVMRIDPASNQVDSHISLGYLALPYTYSDMTGHVLRGAPDQGTWTIIHDSGGASTRWGSVDWTADTHAGGSLDVEASSSEDGDLFGPVVRVGRGEDLAVADGRYLKIRVRFTRSPEGESPILYDLTVAPEPEVMPDLTAALLKVVDNGIGSEIGFNVRIGNAGTADVPGMAGVTLYQGEPGDGGRELASLPLESLAAWEYRDLSFVGVSGFDPGGAALYAVADPGNAVVECAEGNNRVQTLIEGSSLGRIEVVVEDNEVGAHEAMRFSASVTNGGALPGRFEARLVVEAPDGRPVAAFPYHDLGSLQGGATIGFSEQWNSADYLSGSYTLRGIVRGEGGQIQHEAITTFGIAHPDAPHADLRITAGRPVYHTHDSVQLEILARNLTLNTLIDDARLGITVTDPGGNTLFTSDVDLGQLVPGGTREIVMPVGLVGADHGDYEVNGVLLDGVDGDTLAEARGVFSVEVDLERSITGRVEAQFARRYVGEPQSCSDRLSNSSVLVLDDLLARQTLLRLDTETEVLSDIRNVSLGAAAGITLVRDVATGTLEPGDYACALQVYLDSKRKWVTLGRAQFRLDPPPIVIEANLGAGPRGRLLVLLDDPNGPAAPGGRDPHGVAEVADLPAQRAWLDAKLSAAGWSYSIVTDTEAFVAEQRSGGYNLYLLQSEQVHLSEEAQKALREAVRAGDGLVVAGDHDQRNHRLDAALGLAFRGSANADGLRMSDGASLAFIAPRRAARVVEEGASLLATFNPSGDPAVTHHDYGEGEAAYIGFDLLAEGAAGGSDALAELLLGALEAVNPEPAAPVAGGPLAVRLTLENQGIATPGRVLLPLPDGVTTLDVPGAVRDGDTLVWSFDLAEEASWRRDLWLRLPEATGPLSLTAAIETGSEPDWAPYDQVSWALTVAPRATVQEALALLDSSGLPRNQQVRVERDLNDAAAALARGDRDTALGELLKAADVLLDAPPEAAFLRLAVARAVRDLH